MRIQILRSFPTIAVLGLFLVFSELSFAADSKDVLKQGLLGAGVGAISAEASGGKAGKGALVGAGTNVIGGALIDMLSGGGQQSAPPPARRPRYREQRPQGQYEDAYYDDEYYEPAPRPTRTRRAAPRPAPSSSSTSSSGNVLKQGLLGAGVGAISAEASGGKAGKGALIGAGTNVLGGALLDFLGGGGSSQPQESYYEEPYEEEYYYEEEEEFYGEPGYEEGSQPLRRRRVIQKGY